MFQHTENYMIDKSKTFFKSAISNQLFFTSTAVITENMDEIIHTWERNPKLISEYMKLVDERFHDELKWKDEYKKISDGDFNSYFYIVTFMEQVIAGAKISLCRPGSDMLISSEKNNFTYRSFFPELNLYDYGYADIDDYANMLEFRNTIDYARSFRDFKLLFDKEKIRYVFLPASRSRQRLYKSFASRYFNLIAKKKYDLKEVESRLDIPDSGDYYFYVYENNKQLDD